MKRDSKKLEEKAKNMFDLLRLHLNDNVTMIYYRYGRPEIRTGILQDLHDFICVDVGGLSIPFVGYEVVIVKITNTKGEVLYSNQNPIQDLTTVEQINEAKKEIFGEEIVTEEIKKREEAEKRYKEESNPINVQKSRLTLQKEGIPYVKPGMLGEWLEFVEKNGIGPDVCIINAAIETMKSLADDVPYEEISEIFFEFGLTEYQKIAVINCVAHFSNLGPDFKDYCTKESETKLNKVR